MKWMQAIQGALLSVGLMFAAGAGAEQKIDDGAYRVHYAALNTRDLSPDIARAFGVRRSSTRGLLVLNAQFVDGDETLPVPAAGSGHVRNLIGHQQALELRPAQEGPVHYLLAEFEFVDREHLQFDLQVTPQGHSRPVTIRFKQQFYAD